MTLLASSAHLGGAVSGTCQPCVASVQTTPPDRWVCNRRSYNPWDVVDFPTYDAVYLNDRTMPGGSAVSSSYTFNLGIVGVHEVGELNPNSIPTNVLTLTLP